MLDRTYITFDQPDLDFGFYRIMHSKALEVQDFINNDLLHIVSEAFGDGEETENAELKWGQTQNSSRICMCCL